MRLPIQQFANGLPRKLARRMARDEARESTRWLLFFKRYPTPRALPMEGFACEEGEYTWEKWKQDTKAAYPVQYWLRKTMPFFFRVKFGMRIEHAWYWFRSHTYRRYHLLDLRNDTLDYKWGWADTDTRMMAACFNLLTEFVEKERPFDVLNWDWNDDHSEAEVEIKALYEWWKTGRKADQNAQDALRDNLPVHDGTRAGRMSRYESPEWKALEAAEASFDARDTEMLIRLVKVRKFLWT